MILHSSRSGMMLLTTVMIMGAVSLIVAFGIANRSLQEVSIGFGGMQGSRALALAEGCAQEALLQLSRDSGYSGDTLAIHDGTCEIEVTANGSNRTILSSTTVESWTRAVTVDITISGRNITIVNWQQSAP